MRFLVCILFGTLMAQGAFASDAAEWSLDDQSQAVFDEDGFFRPGGGGGRDRFVCTARSTSVAGEWIGAGDTESMAQTIALGECDRNGPRRHCYLAGCRDRWGGGHGGPHGGFWVCSARSRAVGGVWYGRGQDRYQAEDNAINQCDLNGPRRHCYIEDCRFRP